MAKHIFVINPSAGQGKTDELTSDIEAVCTAGNLDYEIYETKKPGDAEEYVRQCCEAGASEAQCCEASALERGGGQTGAADGADRLRFYACGGDGTLNEVVNGVSGYDFAEAGCIPVGTGNDFVRNFPDARFDDLIAQVRGESSLCDLIRYEGVCDGQEVSRYCVNMFNIGFDSNVVDMTSRMKRVPLVTGPMAYLASILTMLIEKKGAQLRVEYEDGFVYDGKLLLISIANGCFCGGGIKGLPRAVTDDGLFDVSLVKNVPRHVFLRLFPKYMKGTHLAEKRLADVVRYTHEKSLLITPKREVMKLCVDGEITKAGQIRMQVCPKAFRFIVPDRSRPSKGAVDEDN